MSTPIIIEIEDDAAGADLYSGMVSKFKNAATLIFECDGQIHCAHGPAIHHVDGYVWFYLDGLEYSFEDWKEELLIRDQELPYDARFGEFDEEDEYLALQNHKEAISALVTIEKVKRQNEIFSKYPFGIRGLGEAA